MLTDAQRKTLDRIAASGSYLDGYSPTAAEALRAALAEIDGQRRRIERLMVMLESLIAEGSKPCS